MALLAEFPYLYEYIYIYSLDTDCLLNSDAFPVFGLKQIDSVIIAATTILKVVLQGARGLLCQGTKSLSKVTCAWAIEVCAPATPCCASATSLVLPCPQRPLRPPQSTLGQIS